MKCKAIYIIILSSFLSLIPQAGMASDNTPYYDGSEQKKELKMR